MENFVGKVLGNRYEVRNEIGEGGMAVVYKAYDTVEQREVAVKVLKDEHMANEEYRKRFRDESRSLSLLSHDNIVKVYDFSFGENLQYIVMEYINGVTLKEFIKRSQALTWKYALYFTIQMLRALQHAHDNGIIHRDIKPQNIMVLKNGQIKVTDFGIAKFSRIDSSTFTQNGVALGSAQYMSPEQAKGEKTDSRSDIYSAGVVLYEMLTGHLPFDSDNLTTVLLNQVQDEPPRPTSLNSDIPKGLEQITLRAMQKNANDRYQTAAEMLRDLDAVKNDPNKLFGYSLITNHNSSEHSQTVAAPAVSSGYERRTGQQTPYVRPQPEKAPADSDEGYAEPSGRSGSVTIPVLVVILVLLLAGVSFVGVKVYKTYFAVDQVEVPQFIGKSYEAVIEEYGEQFNFEDQPDYVYNSDYEEGIVCNQSVKAGEKIKAGKTILLSVAANSESQKVPDVSGKMFTDASSILKSFGFKVVSKPVTDETKEEGYVVKSDPPANTMAAYRSVVTLYVVTRGNKVVVPDVRGLDKEEAEKVLKDAGLKVKIVTDSSDEDKKDKVIRQSVDPDTEVEADSEITITVGNGVPEEVSGKFTVQLPDADGKSATVKCVLAGETVDSSSVKLDGSDVSLSLSGKGKNNSLKVYIGDFLYIEGTVDFSDDDLNVQIDHTYTYKTETTTPEAEKEAIPEVVGMSESDAKFELNKAGFSNIGVDDYETDEYAPGTVISVSPDDGAKHSLDVSITIRVARAMPALTQAPADDPNNSGGGTPEDENIEG